MRSKKQLMKLINDQLKRNPKAVIRLEVEKDECSLVEDIAREKMWAQVQTGSPAILKPDVYRYALITPDTDKPKPLEFVPVYIVKDMNKKAPDDVMEKGQRKAARLQKQYGDNYYVQLDIAGYYLERPLGLYCIVWRIWDWVADQTIAFTPREIALFLSSHILMLRQIEPLARKQVESVKHLKRISTQGGKATAHYSNLEFEAAFEMYRKRNPAKTAWDAAQGLTRTGRPLERSKADSAYKRASRLAKSLSISVEDWYQSLG